MTCGIGSLLPLGGVQGLSSGGQAFYTSLYTLFYFSQAWNQNQSLIHTMHLLFSFF